MEGSKRKCSLGNSGLGTNRQCSQEDTFKSFDIFNERQKTSISRRSECESVVFVCVNHEKLFLTFYGNNQNSCCDPFGNHRNLVKTSLWSITAEFETIHSQKFPTIIEGKKVCSNCRTLLKQTSEVEEKVEIKRNIQHLERQALGLSLASTDENTQTTDSYDTPTEIVLENINDSLKLLRIKPITMKQLQNTKYRQEKLKEISSTYESCFDKLLGVECDVQFTGKHKV